MSKALFLVTAFLFCGLFSRVASATFINGNFSSGNTGFSSDYVYVASGGSVRQYTIAANPGTFETGLESFGDHTTGSGMMMVVDGFQPGTNVWLETTTVTPGTNYTFSGWFRPTYGQDLAQIALNVGSGTTSLASLAPATLTDGAWKQLSVNFNSGTNSSVTASFSDQNANYLAVGDDFAADDLALSQIVPVPEPGGLAIVAIGALSFLRRIRRAR